MEIQEAEQNGDAHPAEPEEDTLGEADAQEEKEGEDEPTDEPEDEDESVTYHHTIFSCLAHLHTLCVFTNLL